MYIRNIVKKSGCCLLLNQVESKLIESFQLDLEPVIASFGSKSDENLINQSISRCAAEQSGKHSSDRFQTSLGNDWGSLETPRLSQHIGGLKGTLQCVP